MIQLVREEGPITESWLVRRYAAQSRLNPIQVKAGVIAAALNAAAQKEILRVVHPCGQTDYLIPGQPTVLRERGKRSPEDIPFGEWCALLHALPLKPGHDNQDKAFGAAANAYRFGMAAAPSRPIVGRAWQAIEHNAARA
ncbi:hypothetical protein ACFSC4_15645 [Deinococcus malanensis]|uniref:hypothetical protein n=1 Tax=Deinococcus malanensis TaxID=1706855 RepID=UPI00363903B1